MSTLDARPDLTHIGRFRSGATVRASLCRPETLAAIVNTVIFSSPYIVLRTSVVCPLLVICDFLPFYSLSSTSLRNVWAVSRGATLWHSR